MWLSYMYEREEPKEEIKSNPLNAFVFFKMPYFYL